MKGIILMVMILAVFLTALKVVTTRHEARKLFVEIQALEQVRDSLNEEWGKLQLEQSTWATDGRVESMARTKLGMKLPSINSKVIVAQ